MSLDPSPSIFRNQLLSALGAQELALLAPHLTPVELKLREGLESVNKPITHAVFPESGIVSVVAHGARRKQLEIGIIGHEGMTGLMVVLGDDRSPHSTYVQVAGHGHRIAADKLRDAVDESRSLRGMFLHFAQAFLIQTAQTAVSNGSARLEERLARWLLMAHDRIDGDDLPLIHDFLALMLSVRRSGVTVALHSLEKRGLIAHKRGHITLIDRTGLRKVASSSYGIPEAEYARLVNGPG